MKKDRAVFAVCTIAFFANFVLFLTKLYIGLRTNSISIYSDSVNNLFDCLSGLITLISLSLIMKNTDASTEETASKSQQLFSFLMSLALSFTGLYFAYTSVERLMYPTPIWYTPFYLWALIATALAKLVLFAVYKFFLKKSSSPVIKVMAYDSILDFFITSVTVLSLYISSRGSFSFDAIFGIFISAFLIGSAFKLVISHAKSLIDFVKADDRREIENILSSNGVEAEKISFLTYSDVTTAYVTASVGDNISLSDISEECLKKTGIILNFTVK